MSVLLGLWWASPLSFLIGVAVITVILMAVGEALAGKEEE